MNERIKQLAEGMFDVVIDHRGREECSTDYAGIERFAQVIIQECARIARATPCPYDDEEIKQVFGHTWDIAALAAGRSIKDYFGGKDE